MKLIKWWNAGKKYMGRDVDGCPMYTLTNGERVVISAVITICAIWMSVIVASLICYVRGL